MDGHCKGAYWAYASESYYSPSGKSTTTNLLVVDLNALCDNIPVTFITLPRQLSHSVSP